MAPLVLLTAALALATSISASPYPLARRQNNTDSDCPGYRASDISTTDNGLTAKLTLAGSPCNIYGKDIQHLTLKVEYQTDTRLHVLIEDAAQEVYQVPGSVFPRPASSGSSNSSSALVFDHVEEPFSFSVKRRSTGEVLFDSSAASLIFEDQYIRLRTSLPEDPNLYGTGEHTDPFRLQTTGYTRTAWNRDAYGAPPGTNLYGTHPIYYDHRGANGTHGVFLLNSNGMDFKIDNTGGQHLEYNILGGVLDFYFLAGPSPVEVAQQYSEVSQKSALQPYWGLGFHQCKYGYRDVYYVAEVVANYSAAGIPLETMWTDIDYMHLRWVFTLDEDRFPLSRMRELVSTLHERQQHYIVMVDPAVAYQDYDAFNNGVEQDVFLQRGNGSIYKGVVWPGVTAFPDWFHPNTQGYWNSEFQSFFDADTGVDIDALWIDMNEPSNFCSYPCANPELEAELAGNPPQPPPIRLGSPRPIPGFPADFQPVCKSVVTFNVNASTFYGENILVFGSAITIGSGDEIENAAALGADNYPIWSAAVDLPANTEVTYQYVRSQPGGSFIYESTNRTLTTGDCGSTSSTNDTITTSSPPQSKLVRRAAGLSQKTPHLTPVSKRQAAGNMVGLPGRDLINPAYQINNAAGSISNKTADTDIIQYGGYAQYDTHNTYGSQMSEASRNAMLSRRPGLRPMIITRSTFAGAGAYVGKWLGDNFASWSAYLESIPEVIEFAAMYNVPLVGPDVCGFGGNTNELLCARWALLGSFTPFFRNHAENSALDHEFYRWPLVADAAKNGIAQRYKLLDYIYTAFYVQNQTGTPLIQPMFYHYPEDSDTFALGYQYFYGPGIMVAPVTTENSTTATHYMPNGIFYDYWTHEKIVGTGETITVENVNYTSIPLYYKGGSIIAQRSESANTTTELRKKDFDIIIAPSANGTAYGELYLDDGVSLVQDTWSYMKFTYQSNGRFTITGQFGYDTDCYIKSVTVLGREGSNSTGASRTTVESRISLMQEYEGVV